MSGFSTKSGSSDNGKSSASSAPFRLAPFLPVSSLLPPPHMTMASVALSIRPCSAVSTVVTKARRERSSHSPERLFAVHKTYISGTSCPSSVKSPCTRSASMSSCESGAESLANTREPSTHKHSMLSTPAVHASDTIELFCFTHAASSALVRVLRRQKLSISSRLIAAAMPMAQAAMVTKSPCNSASCSSYTKSDSEVALQTVIKTFTSMKCCAPPPRLASRTLQPPKRSATPATQPLTTTQGKGSGVKWTSSGGVTT
mmetsp:Transcript_17251/g.53491  ORF Transcript_17251/g.53491 Transcript_17251/m.53491 type:complete len:258 (-) Transcript_17251:1565-2338(-)